MGGVYLPPIVAYVVCWLVGFVVVDEGSRHPITESNVEERPHLLQIPPPSFASRYLLLLTYTPIFIYINEENNQQDKMSGGSPRKEAQ